MTAQAAHIGGGKEHKPCAQCGREFVKKWHESRPLWATRRFCSRNCSSQSIARPGTLDGFLSLVSPEPNTGCWFWLGSLSHYGKKPYRLDYGFFKEEAAHRVSYRLHFGVDPGDLFVCHSCDMPPCVNPEHLFLGTSLDNSQDAVRKGRHAHGERNLGGGKLTKDDVVRIRNEYRLGALQMDLADSFGVTQGLISAIIRRAIWRHV